MTPRIGFAGLGTMGAGMARCLLTKGFPLTVWNRTPSRAAPLAVDGAHVAPTPRALALASDIVITCLADPMALEHVAFADDGLLAGLREGARFIDTSTIGVPAALRLAAAAAARGVGYLEAPVTGSRLGAQAGTLVAMTGGPRELHDELLPVLGAFTARAIYVGPHGAAAMTKLVGNMIISFMLEGLAEGAVLAAHAGISIETLLEVVQASGFASPYWAFKGGQIARRDFDAHFTLDLLHKDQALALAEGAARRVPLPALAAIHQVTSHARALGVGGEDIAAQVKAIEAAAGVTVRSVSTRS